MNLNQIKAAFLGDAHTALIADRLQHGKARLQLRHLSGSAGSFTAFSVAQTFPGFHLFILGDKEEAAYFLNDLENLMQEETPERILPVLFFPSSYETG